MKTNSSYSLVPFQAVQNNLKGGNASVLAPSLALTTAVVALLLIATCTTANAAGKVAGGVAPLADDLRFQLGKVALAPDPKLARVSFDKADGQIADAADAAGTAAGNMLATSGPDLFPKELEGVGALVQAPVQVGAFLLAPGAAVKGAIGARKRMALDQLSECERNLVAAMSEMAVQRRFHEQLLKAANEKCPGRLVSLEQVGTTHANTTPPDSVLEARVEELRLERTGARDTSFQLRIKAQMRLTRVADGQVLYEEPAEYRSAKCLFADWTLHNAFQATADTGYYLLAQQCATRLLAITDQPTVAGAGDRKTVASSRPATARPVGGQLPRNRVPAQLVSQPMPTPGTLGIYSTGTVAHVVIQRPLTRDQAGLEALSDVNDTFDGLLEHPNLLVVAPAAAVATPVSLWKQGAAVVRGLSPRKAQEVEARLTEAANETRPHEELAFQVAQHLAPRTSQPVMLVQQPLPPAVKEDVALLQWAAHGTLAALTGGQTAAGYLLSQGADTALEIRVQDAALTGNGGINPKLALCVEARATLVRSRDGQPVYSCPVCYRSPARKFTAWAANDAKHFREELQKCYHALGEAVTEQLVARGVVPPDRKPQPTFAGK
jgi:hypothetical protein